MDLMIFFEILTTCLHLIKVEPKLGKSANLQARLILGLAAFVAHEGVAVANPIASVEVAFGHTKPIAVSICKVVLICLIHGVKPHAKLRRCDQLIAF